MHRDRTPFVAKEEVMNIGGQGCPDSAGSHVPAAEVSDDGSPGAFRNDCGLSDLKSGSRAETASRIFHGNMEERLPVAADEIDLCHVESGLLCHLNGRLRKSFPQAEIKLADSVDGTRVRLTGLDNVPAEAGVERISGMGQEIHPRFSALSTNVD